MKQTDLNVWVTEAKYYLAKLEDEIGRMEDWQTEKEEIEKELERYKTGMSDIETIVLDYV